MLVRLMLVSPLIFMWASGGIYSACFEKNVGDPFQIGLSVILGYISFQWKGIVYGPLMIGLLKTLLEIVKMYLKEKTRS